MINLAFDCWQAPVLRNPISAVNVAVARLLGRWRTLNDFLVAFSIILAI
jgi:hypothetical protein